MEILFGILAEIFMPLTAELVLGSIAAGLCFGLVYNRILDLPVSVSYHTLISGIGFIFFLFLFRLGSAIMSGIMITNPLGWVGIGLLWAIFCVFMWIGHLASESL